MCSIIYFEFVTNTTAYRLGWYSLHLLLQKSSMDRHNSQTNLKCVHASSVSTFWYFINTTAYHFGQQSCSWQSSKKLKRSLNDKSENWKVRDREREGVTVSRTAEKQKNISRWFLGLHFWSDTTLYSIPLKVFATDIFYDAEIKLSDWMFQVMWLLLTNHSVNFPIYQITSVSRFGDFLNFLVT